MVLRCELASSFAKRISRAGGSSLLWCSASPARPWSCSGLCWPLQPPWLSSPAPPGGAAAFPRTSVQPGVTGHGNVLFPSPRQNPHGQARQLLPQEPPDQAPQPKAQQTRASPTTHHPPPLPCTFSFSSSSLCSLSFCSRRAFSLSCSSLRTKQGPVMVGS